MALLELDNVSKTYPGADDGPGVTVLRDVSLRVDAGETLAITGPSGCGKSTLLNLIGALDSPSVGSVRIDGRDLGALRDRELADLRNRRIGFVFQAHHLLPQLSALENVLIPLLARGRVGEAESDRAAGLLDRVGLGSRAGHRPGQLSGGERQRVAVVRALITEPDLVLADEPTGALDAEGAARLVDLLLELTREQSRTLIMVSHAETLAARMGRVHELRDGALAASLPGTGAGAAP